MPAPSIRATTQSGNFDVALASAHDAAIGDGHYEAAFGTGQGRARLTTDSGNNSLLGP